MNLQKLLQNFKEFLCAINNIFNTINFIFSIATSYEPDNFLGDGA